MRLEEKLQEICTELYRIGLNFLTLMETVPYPIQPCALYYI